MIKCALQTNTIQIKHNKVRIPTGGRLSSWLFTRRGGVEFGATENKSIQWQGGGFEPGTSGLQIQRPTTRPRTPPTIVRIKRTEVCTKMAEGRESIMFSYLIMNFHISIQTWSWCSRCLSSVGNRYPAKCVASFVLNVKTVLFKIKFTRPFLLQGFRLFCYQFVE